MVSNKSAVREMTLEDSQGSRDKCLATNSPPVDFSSVLSRTIESIRGDPAHLRNAIYELARINLQREALLRDPPMGILEVRRLMLALETAIERVETISSQRDGMQALQSLSRLLERPNSGGSEFVIPLRGPVPIFDHAAIATIDNNRFPSFLVRADDLPPSQTPNRFWSGLAPFLLACTAAIIAVVLFAILNGQFIFRSQTQVAVKGVAPTIEKSNASGLETVIQPQPNAAKPQSSGLPLPSVYGVYAISSGQLYELEALPGRVPDQRVFMSTAINKPAPTILPDGRIVFIVFRRDVVTSAPDRVAVRVVAKVMRAMTFDAGKPSTTRVDDAWAVRSNSYEFRVAPLSENPEMLVIRPENSDFAFPAGRYAMVLKGQGYDFTVSGAITEAAQCLERVEAANGTFYTECRKP
jgi:hypothetical protein